MKLRLLVIAGLVLWLLVGCSKKEEGKLEQQQQADDGERAALIVLDRSHEMRNEKDMGIEAYKIESCEVLIVDHSYREYVLPEEKTPIGPRTIHLLNTDQSKYYRMVWEKGSEIMLNSETLVPRGNTVGFRRFRAGEEYFLAIGHDNYDDALVEETEFQVIMLYRIEVTKRENQK